MALSVSAGAVEEALRLHHMRASDLIERRCEQSMENVCNTCLTMRCACNIRLNGRVEGFFVFSIGNWNVQRPRRCGLEKGINGCLDSLLPCYC